MMNELQRQTYLSVLGVDTYMPRWHLPFAPISVACELPEAIAFNDGQVNSAPFAINATLSSSSISQQQTVTQQSAGSITPINNLISDIFATKKITKVEFPLKTSVEPAEVLSIPAIEAFSLSVWRPIEGLMIVDSRNTKLALPTDTLLKNIFRQLYPKSVPNFKEEVLRCPMIENSFAKRTADDARAELQTWLSVQSEIRPISYLWLMGENAARYLTEGDGDKGDCLWRSCAIADSNIQALVLPSLNELLLNSLLKKSLSSAIRQYHSQSYE